MKIQPPKNLLRNTNMKLNLLILTLAILTGCANTTTSELRGPDGSSMKNVKCNIDSQKCFVSASESCKATNGTYQVITSHSNAGGTMADIVPGPVTWFNMTYVCGPSDGKMPDFAFRGSEYSAPAVIVNQPQQQRRATTNCSKLGNNINCTTY